MEEKKSPIAAAVEALEPVTQTVAQTAPGEQAPPVPPEDQAWLARLPLGLHPVYQRHGRATLALVLQAGAVQHAFGEIQRRGRGNRHLAVAVQVIATALEAQAQELMRLQGISMEKFRECTLDTDRVAALMGAALEGAGARSPGGIILQS